ncbi:MAG: AbrB/MazE/SpoVT family DNA-binding domain-containing protein [Burkholderiales bacterium]|jgi:antitoxin component of MazEF toxin-antitoxin module|nr:AbrB/MazE/SpoVT family DNA-binding domain-containing protein [Burkholderiales bacterium]
MSVVLQKWGNSAAVRVPAAVLRELGIALGDRLDLKTDAGRLVLSPATRRPRLADLLAATPRRNNRADGWDDMAGTERER